VFLGGTRIDANQIASIHRKSVKNLSMPKCPQGSRLWRSTRDTALTASRLFGRNVTNRESRPRATVAKMSLAQVPKSKESLKARSQSSALDLVAQTVGSGHCTLATCDNDHQRGVRAL
jgi:hypothetical protein